MLKSRTVFILIVILSILVAAYFVLFETKTESQTIDLNSLEMLSHELTEDGLSLLYFEMPSDYIIRQDLSDSLSFEPVDYYKEGTLLSPSLKKCVESSNGMFVIISMNDRSFDPRLLPSEEFVENRDTFAKENGWLTSIETIDGQMFSRAEKTDANCEYSYTVSYSGQVEGYITQFQFWFEGDYQENIALIESILDSMDFKLE